MQHLNKLHFSDEDCAKFKDFCIRFGSFIRTAKTFDGWFNQMHKLHLKSSTLFS